MPPLQIDLPATRESLEPARRAVLDYLALSLPRSPLMDRVELVLEEVLMNIVWHAYGKRGGAMRVRVEVLSDQVALTFEDEGLPFDPVTSALRELPQKLSDAQPGGLGVRLVRGFAREMAYERTGGTNRLRVGLAL